ncbi:MAG: ribonuclease [Frankiales bacterium]|jgi:ribonuclease HI|nr:ribonuclease [Frankiales bacterium]
MDNLDENAINIFVDGSSYSGPRVGGMGVRIITIDDAGNEVVHDDQPLGVQGATNQQMELMACIEALQILRSRRSPVEDPDQYRRILIKTDSMYVQENYPRAMFQWPRSGWRTKDGAPVANAELWKKLLKEVRSATPRRVDIEWVKGHKSSIHNKAADRLAKGSAKGATRAPLTITTVRRKKTSQSVERGSVPLTGQRLTIRIITDEYLRVQHCYRFKYEVMSKASPYFGNVDIAFADFMLRAGHTYFVQMGTNTKSPEIVKCYREIETKG